MSSSAMGHFESEIGKDLLHLACRHHVYELVLEGAFEQALSHANSPDIHPLFLKFLNFWKQIDQGKFITLGRAALRRFPGNPDEVIEFCTNQLKVIQPRDDYKEFLQLTIIFLGGIPPGGISFRKPGALNKTRWMARAVYALKMYMFQKQYPFTRAEKKGLEDICIFVSAAYVKFWFECPSATMAPLNDLEFLKLLKRYESFTGAWSAALTKLMSHLRYLSADLAPLALYDNRVPTSVKKDMIKNNVKGWG
ncbi:uncharacterized protein LOC117649636 [Thrips palmi]|uniref:Uncharacterized protein LOC117649636 n=1 Tax=Thrips palmi TaxID=161013 RepID=A0A6P8ZT39_THRPL|nr:uncharacterized protein LOC117649636 [Thrips palmi]